jgi:hypothetical protein
MSATYIIHGEKWNLYIWPENLKEHDQILEKQAVSVGTGLIWLRTASSGGLLWAQQ